MIAQDADQPAPVIDSFAAEEVGIGWYQFTGHVSYDQPGGLTITFGGVPSLEGKFTTTAADGSFSLLVQVQTDGSDTGEVTAQTSAANGSLSNLAMCYISPTR